MGQKQAEPVAATVESCLPQLLMFFRKRRPMVAEDLAQEVMVRALGKLQGGAILEVPMCCYLLGIARNVLLEEYRRPPEDSLDPEIHSRQGNPRFQPIEEHIDFQQIRRLRFLVMFRGIPEADRDLFLA